MGVPFRHGAPRLGGSTQAALSAPSARGCGVALVTGASVGIGAAIARMLARAGHAVVLCGRDAGRLAAVAEGLGPKIHILQLDMSDAAALKTLPATLPPAFTNIDILVNAAGDDVGGRRPFDEGDPDEWAAIIETSAIPRLARSSLVIGEGPRRYAPARSLGIPGAEPRAAPARTHF
jgi:NADP-dependent 3-hydroxy acid dehydrogenase YdfG